MFHEIVSYVTVCQLTSVGDESNFDRRGKKGSHGANYGQSSTIRYA